MKLKKLEFVGFKSFYDKTRIDFHNNMNGIVGPNGCGKSNIIDAIKWVMGEQNPRNLRAISMDELISNGGETLKPLGMAEVSMIISSDNGNGFENISIKRRLYRSGISEYFINEVPCRLKDISELFVDTGIGARAYSIIGQGKVESIITSKPEGKREVIEEVAGIGKYKLRRKETQRRIESTRQNLSLVKESQAEILRQIKSLKKQADDAENYKKIAEEAENLEYKILLKKKSDLENLKSKYEGEKEHITSGLTENFNRLNNLKDKSAELRNEIYSIEKMIDGTRDEVLNHSGQLQLTDSRLDLNLREERGIDELAIKLIQDRDSYNKEIDEIENLINQRRSEYKNFNESIQLKQNDIYKHEAELNTCKNELLTKRNEYNRHREDLLKSLDEYSVLKTKIVSFEQELKEINSRIKRISDEKFDLYKNSVLTRCELNSSLDLLRTVICEELSLIEKTRAINLRIEKVSRSKDLTDSELREKEEELSQTNSRLNVLRKIQNNYEWLPQELGKFIRDHKGKGIIGVLADFITVPEKYEMALEAALAEKLKWCLVKDMVSAGELINDLEKLELGRGTFYPLENKSSKGSVLALSESMTALKDVVEVSEIDRDIIDGILDRIYITTTINEVTDLGIRLSEGYSYVTPEGDYIDSSGYITGGKFSDSVFERKREIEELAAKSKLLYDGITASRGELTEMNRSLSNLSSESSSSGVKLKQLEIYEAEIRKDIDNLSDRCQRYLERMKIVEFELNGYQSDKNKKADTLELISRDISVVENKKQQLESGFRELESTLSNLEIDDESLKHTLTQKKIELAATTEKLNSIDQEILYNASRKNNLGVKILLNNAEVSKITYGKADIVKNILELKQKKSLIENALDTYRRQIQEQQNRHNELQGVLTDMEQQNTEVQSTIDQLRTRSSETDLKLNSTDLEIRHIAERIKIPHDQTDYPDIDFDIEKIEQKLLQLKEKLERFGPVNLLAPEEYLQLDERNRFLTEQVNDLEEAILSLKRAITKIDRESKKRFEETFILVNEKFKEVFPRIFRGGEGKLELTDPDDLLNTGVEVYVRPRGKKFQSINLLSGGEKALCAISLVLSACFVRPAPFLLLDEIDAPLDDNNTANFVELVKEISDESQILLITHNKKTMLDVNYLIGITSEKPGTSKVVSVELH